MGLHHLSHCVAKGSVCRISSSAAPCCCCTCHRCVLACSQEGLEGRKSKTFYDLLRVVGALQQLQPDRPPAFILENAPMQVTALSKGLAVVR